MLTENIRIAKLFCPERDLNKSQDLVKILGTHVANIYQKIHFANTV